MDDILVSMVAKINENPELHNFERLSESSTDLFEKMRRICGKQFESDYLQKRRALSEAKLKFKEERKLLSVNNPKLYFKKIRPEKAREKLKGLQQSSSKSKTQ